MPEQSAHHQEEIDSDQQTKYHQNHNSKELLMKTIDKTVLAGYNAGIERDRLRAGIGLIEFERTKEILLEKLPKPPAVIYDIGGAYGEYSWWLSSLGYEVHLFDLSETKYEEVFPMTNEQRAKIVYEDLKRLIVSCEILPGAQLTEEALCERLKASRTPVRDAVSRLEQEQLLTIHPKKGIYVNTVSLANVCELFEARLRIEPYAVRYYGNRIGDDVYADYAAYFSVPHPKGLETYQRDDAFHQMFVDASHNRYL